MPTAGNQTSEHSFAGGIWIAMKWLGVELTRKINDLFFVHGMGAASETPTYMDIFEIELVGFCFFNRLSHNPSAAFSDSSGTLNANTHREIILTCHFSSPCRRYVTQRY